MAIATHSRPRRAVLPLVNLAVGTGAAALAVIALADDDVADVVQPQPPPAVVEAPAYEQPIAAEVETCGIARVDRC